MTSPWLFYPLATVVVAGALAVILSRRPVYGVLSLVVTLFALAGLFVLLEAFFIAAIQILVYAGAILVLFLFVVMLLNLGEGTAVATIGRPLHWLGLLVAIVFLGALIPVIVVLNRTLQGHVGEGQAGTTEAIGAALFTQYLLPFEAISLLLLVAILGAVVLAKRSLS